MHRLHLFGLLLALRHSDRLVDSLRLGAVRVGRAVFAGSHAAT